MSVNTNLSIEQLENDFWSDPEIESSLVKKCHELRKRSIGELSIEDLRLLIGQQIGLPFIVPLAMEYLVKNPFNEGDLFKGALLSNVLRIDSAFWAKNQDLYDVLFSIMNDLAQVFELYQNDLLPKWEKVSNKSLAL